MMYNSDDGQVLCWNQQTREHTKVKQGDVDYVILKYCYYFIIQMNYTNKFIYKQHYKLGVYNVATHACNGELPHWLIKDIC